MPQDEREVRRSKLESLRAAGVEPFRERYERTHTLAEASALPEETKGLRLCGRLMSVRTFGKLTFAHLQDGTGRLQIALDKKSTPEAVWTLFHDAVDRGDWIGAAGELFRTRRGELTLRVGELELLSKALRPLPEKWHGLKDAELRQRRRYLDLLMSEETRKRFDVRCKVLRTLRAYLDDHGFVEVDTPVLQTVPSGAAARPFITHHNALDLDVYLRIAPETWLKRLIVGGYDRVYEFARCFRNEGMDPSHLQDFTMLEYYSAFWNWEDNLRFTERLMRHLVQEISGSQVLEWRGQKIDFGGEWPRIDLGVLVREKSGIDIDAHADADSLRGAIAGKGIGIEKMDQMGRGNLIDALYKVCARQDLVQPCFVTRIPAETLPLARRNDADPGRADCFVLVVNGWELVKAYSELIDPIDQRERFAEQERLRTGGDQEAMFLDEDYLEAMEYGMPPVSGWGMGIERVVSLLTGADNLRDVVFFPLLRPLDPGALDEDETATDEAPC
ncbi:MAG: lysine--tRNA ligase [Planctomycetota bacterium]|nr:lysine--tRNA ligase [Planctomycetota bacterium]